jgi:hypothetical protein
LASLTGLARVLALIVPAVFLIVYLVLRMLAPDMQDGTRLSNALGTAAGMAFLLGTGFVVVWIVVRLTGPRTVTIAWSSRRLTEQVRGHSTEYDLASIRAIELRRTEVTGESGSSSFQCELFARVAVPQGEEKAVEILKTAMLDDPEPPYRMTEPYAATLAHALGVAVEVREQRL